MIGVNNSTESFSSTLNHAKERLSDLKDRIFKVVHSEEQKETGVKKAYEN